MADASSFETANGKVWFLRTADDTGGEVHEQRVEYSPGAFHLAAAEPEKGSGLLDRAAFAHEFRDVFRL